MAEIQMTIAMLPPARVATSPRQVLTSTRQAPTPPVEVVVLPALVDSIALPVSEAPDPDAEWAIAMAEDYEIFVSGWNVDAQPDGQKPDKPADGSVAAAAESTASAWLDHLDRIDRLQPPTTAPRPQPLGNAPISLRASLSPEARAALDACIAAATSVDLIDSLKATKRASRMAEQESIADHRLAFDAGANLLRRALHNRYYLLCAKVRSAEDETDAVREPLMAECNRVASVIVGDKDALRLVRNDDRSAMKNHAADWERWHDKPIRFDRAYGGNKPS